MANDGVSLCILELGTLSSNDPHSACTHICQMWPQCCFPLTVLNAEPMSRWNATDGITEVMFSRVAAARKFVVTGMQVTVPPRCVLTHCRKVVHSLLTEAGQTVQLEVVFSCQTHVWSNGCQSGYTCLQLSQRESDCSNWSAFCCIPLFDICACSKHLGF